MLKDIIVESEKFRGKRIGVALSGGRDSVALAYALKGANVNFFARNVEHGIRGGASLSDSRFVKKFCEKYEIELKSYSVDTLKRASDTGESIEQAARALRYEVFDGILDLGECDYIATAHHMNDQVETIVMRILRGTGLRGLCGISAQNGKYLRPFLDYSREDINAYIAKWHLEYVEDETNADTLYTRNFLRQELAAIRLRFPAFDESILRLSRNANEAEAFIEKFVPPPKTNDGEVLICIDDLKDSAIAKRIIMKAVNLLGVYQDIEERHFALIIGLGDLENGKRIELTHGITVHKDCKNIVFCKVATQIFEEVKAAEVETTEAKAASAEIRNAETTEAKAANAEKFNVKVEKVESEEFEICLRKSGALYVDADKIPSGAVWRGRREGDTFTKFGGGTKSLGDFLTDKKISKRKRCDIIVLADGADILLIADIEISDKVKIDNSTKNILKISTKLCAEQVE